MDSTFLFDLTVHHLVFTLEVQTPVHLGVQAGAQLRAALWEALQGFACTDPTAHHNPKHQQDCPMCRLMMLETGGERGQNPARPFAIRPPLAVRAEQERFYPSGATFTVGVNLYGDAAFSFPYICQAMMRMGQAGVGYGRGRFSLMNVEAINRLMSAKHLLLNERREVFPPVIPVNSQQVKNTAAQLPADRLRLRFLTPAHLTSDGRTLNRPDFPILIARLLERCQSLEQNYSPTAHTNTEWRDLHLLLGEAAKQVHLEQDNTRWINVHSGSRRSGWRDNIGGFVGEALFTGDLSLFTPWLIWGEALHVGKNTVKGSGWYEIASN